MKSLPAAALALLALLPACQGERQPDKQAAPENGGELLEEAAVERGLIPGEGKIAFAGRYERRSDIGIDKFCATESGGDFDIGALAVFGSDSQCEGRGTARLDGETVRISLEGKGACEFEARFDGIELVFSGSVPDSCADYCSPRASFSGISYYYVEQGDAAAKGATGRKFRRLCE